MSERKLKSFSGSAAFLWDFVKKKIIAIELVNKADLSYNKSNGGSNEKNNLNSSDNINIHGAGQSGRSKPGKPKSNNK